MSLAQMPIMDKWDFLCFTGYRLSTTNDQRKIPVLNEKRSVVKTIAKSHLHSLTFLNTSVESNR
jgi:hypothetical protein